MPDPFAAFDVAAAPRELIAFGGTLDARTLMSAYRHGVFPWPSTGSDLTLLERVARRLVERRVVPTLPGPDPLLPWYSPDPRAVLLPRDVVVSRSLRQRLRRVPWTTTLDRAFDDVVAACADRDSTWITEEIRRGYHELHDRGVAHSLEVWDGRRLVGGLYGVQVGQVFCGESMFHRETDASKVALVDLCDRLVQAGVQLVDVQQATEHLASLGAVLVRRDDYLTALAALRDAPAVVASDELPVSRLVGS